MGVSEPLAGASAPPASGCCLLDGLSFSAGLGGLRATKPQWSQTAPPQGGERRRGAQALGSFRTLSALHKRLQSSVGLALREPLV